MIITKPAFVDRLEGAETNMLCSRLRAIETIDGNSLGVAIETFGQAYAFSAKCMPGPAFNTVRGLREEEEGQIGKIIRFYEKKELEPQIQLVPGAAGNKVMQALFRQDFCQTGFHSVLAGSCSRQAEERHEGISIRTLKLEDYRLYGHIYTESFGMPAFLKESVATNNAVLHEERNWAFYLAEVEEEPAGVAALFTSGSIAVLAACAVLGRFRKQGVQQALIARRQADAAAAGCTYICGQAGFATTSQRNMERSGLQTIYTKTLWQRVL
ncbi:GNAT family N-acetyltransferase [Shouchella clausii]|uniref:GNAT family N-acetyltransferase n=1 Tax=Shouchella clausii TaxID=79880 RepID=UPI002147C1B0|nr:GNAT family N-acetyltransferase [Shouchella clausii]MCR1289587.1 GNAT family N-acetyltransferase [Shouchella clausii]